MSHTGRKQGIALKIQCLVVSNLVNIVSADFFKIGFTEYAAIMVPVNIVAVAATLAMLMWFFRRDIPKDYDVMQLKTPREAILDSATFKAGWWVLALLLVGFFGMDAMVGAGGLIQIPALLIFASEAQVAAILGTHKFASSVGSAAAVYHYHRAGRLPDRAFLVAIGVPALLGVFLGARTVILIPGQYLRAALLVFVIAAAVYVLFKKDLGVSEVAKDRAFRGPWFGAGIGLAIGFYDGVIVVGAGSLFLLVFVGVWWMDFVSAAAARMINLITNLSAAAAFAYSENILYALALHAQVALDYIIQMKSKSGIDPLVVPETNRKLDATQRVYDALPPELHMDFQLLAVTLAESVLTNEIANLGRENGLAKTFITVMTDHVKDEGRHSKYFAKLMTSRWAQLSPDVQLRFGAMLPDYLDDFLAMDMGRPMDRKVLKACGLDGQEIEKVISDTRQRVEADHEEQSYRTKVRLFKLLRQIGVLDHQQNRLAFTTRTYAA